MMRRCQECLRITRKNDTLRLPAVSKRYASRLSLDGKPFRVCIVGGGPAGFYAASRLLDLQGAESLRVDLFELLPVPFGLSRFGVAPDHPEVKVPPFISLAQSLAAADPAGKNCEHKFEETAKDKRFRFFGNVQVSGTTTDPSHASVVPNVVRSDLAAQIPLAELSPHYDAVILAYGASVDRQLGIPGEDTLLNVLSARSFVNWYNGHPYHSSLLSPLIDLSKVDHVSVIGQGNVALDVARILLKPVDELRQTDLPDYVLAELARSTVKRVDLVGRRGPLQLACTTKEVREMLSLRDVAFEVDQSSIRHALDRIEANPDMKEARARKRMLSLIQKGSTAKLGSTPKSWSFQFLKSPVELLPPQSVQEPENVAAAIARSDRVGRVRYEVNELVASSASADPSAFQAKGTGQYTESATDLVMKSVGYRSIGLPGLPFDSKRGIVKNVEGRVVDDEGKRLDGLYTCGWLSRGPTGVIATTMFDAFFIADLVAQDLAATGPRAESASPAPIRDLASGKPVVSWQDWERIDQLEKERGKAKGKPREKMTKVEEMLDALS